MDMTDKRGRKQTVTSNKKWALEAQQKVENAEKAMMAVKDMLQKAEFSRPAMLEANKAIDKLLPHFQIVHQALERWEDSLRSGGTDISSAVVQEVLTGTDAETLAQALLASTEKAKAEKVAEAGKKATAGRK